MIGMIILSYGAKGKCNRFYLTRYECEQMELRLFITIFWGCKRPVKFFQVFIRYTDPEINVNVKRRKHIKLIFADTKSLEAGNFK